jgi:hypothetical protein
MLKRQERLLIQDVTGLAPDLSGNCRCWKAAAAN